MPLANVPSKAEPVKDGVNVAFVRLPLRAGIVPFPLKEGADPAAVRAACEALKASRDQSGEAASSLKALLRPDVLAVL